MISAIAFTIAIVAYGISQLQQHGKLLWMSKDPLGFWGKRSDLRKYKMLHDAVLLIDEPNWYTRLAKLKYRERWFTSTNLTVSFTDGYHHMQFWMFLSLSFGISQLINIYGWKDFPLIWGAILLIHWLTRRLASKKV